MEVTGQFGAELCFLFLSLSVVLGWNSGTHTCWRAVFFDFACRCFFSPGWVRGCVWEGVVVKSRCELCESCKSHWIVQCLCVSVCH
jgi:hypothetical protein